MSTTTLQLTDQVREYLINHSVKDFPALKNLREHTSTLTGAMMQISPEQGQMMQVLLQMMHAKRVLEIGTFTGYSALVMALALPAEGKVITCDVSKEATELAKKYWQEAGVSHKVEVRLGPALETLRDLHDEEEMFDFVFIDADKGNYLNYYQQVMPLVRAGGVIAIDNVLWDGHVANKKVDDQQTQAIRELNTFIYQDKRVNSCMVPIGDGLTLVYKMY